jgi:hypothetical protein
MQYLESLAKFMGILIPIIGAFTWGIGRLLNNRAKSLANEMMIQQLEGRICDLEDDIEKLKDKFENYKDNHK